MSQDKIQITNTPPLPGTQLVQELNDAFEALATDFSGSVDPAAYAFAYSLWADTGTGDLKRRNAANAAWTKVGRIYPGVIEDASGNVGIGVTPSAWASFYRGFDLSTYGAVYGATINNTGLISNGYFNGTNWIYKNTAAASNYQSGGGTHQWFTAPSGTAGNAISFTQAMTLNASGDLLLGTTGDAGKFRIRHTTSDCISVYASTNTGYVYTTSANSSNAAYFNTNTNTFAGSIVLTGSSTSYVSASDYRLKENVAPMQNALATVAKLKPCTYIWKADGSAGQGFIAHELQAVVPDCVTGEKDAVRIVDELDEDGNKIGTKEEPQYQGVDTSFLVATLVAAIQELKAEFDAYKAAHP